MSTVYKELYEQAQERVKDIRDRLNELQDEKRQVFSDCCDLSFNGYDENYQREKDAYEDRLRALDRKISEIEWKLRDAEYACDQASSKADNERWNGGLEGAIIGAGVGLLIDTVVASFRNNRQQEDPVQRDYYTEPIVQQRRYDISIPKAKSRVNIQKALDSGRDVELVTDNVNFVDVNVGGFLKGLTVISGVLCVVGMIILSFM